MRPIFQGLVAVCLAALAACFILAYMPASWKFAGFGQAAWHMAAGLIAAFLLLALHGFVILNYFIATGKAVDQALEGHPSHAAFRKRTRKLKGRTFPFATMSAFFIIAAAVLGGLAWQRGGHVAHWSVAWFALLFNLFAFKMEAKSIRMNMELLDEVRPIAVEHARAKRAAVVAAGKPDAPAAPSDAASSAVGQA